MPDFIGGLAKGIEKSPGMIENAMNGVTSDLIEHEHRDHADVH